MIDKEISSTKTAYTSQHRISGRYISGMPMVDGLQKKTTDIYQKNSSKKN